MMPQGNDDKVVVVRAELTCPQCDYSLRGLHGDVVNCPECGHECNITAMMTRRWTGPWYHAPGFNRLLIPLTWLVVLGCVAALVYVWDKEVWRTGFVFESLVGVTLVGWIVLLGRVRDVPVQGQGLRLALLAHLLFAGYIAGIVAIVVIFLRAMNSANAGMFALHMLLVLIPMAGFRLMRRGEKYIAQQCIKAWLNRPMEQ